MRCSARTMAPDYSVSSPRTRSPELAAFRAAAKTIEDGGSTTIAAMSVSVRVAGCEDGVALAELRWRWRVDERPESGMDRGQFTTKFTAWMADHAASHTAWIAEVGTSAVGMAWLARIDRMPSPGHWERTAGNLQSVYVVPEHRGGGIGRLLVTAALGQAEAVGMEYISVHPSQRSFGLYRWAGFEDSPGVLELRWPSHPR